MVAEKVVQGSSFKPKGVIQGSVIPDAVTWTTWDVDFSASSWGIKAAMDNVNNDIRFKYPLIITEVVYASEAHKQGIMVGDYVIGVKSPEAADFIDISNAYEKTPMSREKYVLDSVRDILMRGGPCTVRFKRKHRKPCAYCGSESLIEILEEGSIVCSNCAMENNARVMSTQSEWRTFQDDDKSQEKGRTGGPENALLNNDGAQTKIEGNGRNGDVDVIGSAANLAKSQHRFGSQSADRALTDAYKRIDEICDTMNLSSVIRSQAKQNFKSYDEESKKQKKKIPIEPVLTSCIYIACREEGFPRTMKEMCAATLLTKKEIGNAFKHVQEIIKKTVQPMKASDIIPRFCSNLSLEGNVIEEAAKHICQAAEALNITEGRVYTSTASAAMFMACLLRQRNPKHFRTCKEISDATGAAEATIRQIYKEMHAKRHQLVPPDFATKEEIDKLPEGGGGF